MVRSARIGMMSIWLVVACGGGSSGPAHDGVAPTVMSTVPADGATGVQLQPAISATFSEEMSPDSILSDGLRLSPSAPGTVTYSGKTVTFTPSAPLAYETTYKVSIKTSAKDMAGNPLAAEYGWSFSTIAAPPAPIALPGAGQDVNRGETVVLDGSSSQSVSGRPLTYSWTQVLGADVTGGSQVLSGAKPSFAAPAAVGTLQFVLVVNDGLKASAPARVQVNVMEDKAKALFVAVNGDDANEGTRAEPMKTLQAAIDKAAASGADVYMGAGEYAQSLILADGVSLYGGFDADWVRKPGAATKVISDAPKAISGAGVSNLVVDGLTIVSGDAAAPGESSYGILLASSAGVTISNNDITAGNGADGQDGAAGAPGAAGAAGSNGTAGCSSTFPTPCIPFGGAGGNGGPPGGAGGRGNSAAAGSAGQAGSGLLGGTAGAGGASGPVGGTGVNGGAGGNGAAGENGGDANGVGLASFSGYLPMSGTAGKSGLEGSGGGGGGGGGGKVCPPLIFCFPGAGNGAGGGGGGGTGGKGGAPGKGGGGSFGIFLFNSDARAVAPNNTFHLGNGGHGGKGGAGGSGGAGGAAGSGARADTNAVGAGGNGGAGGAGGAGGHGGRGADGPAQTVFSN
jgi:Bacterial Ig-like domain